MSDILVFCESAVGSIKGSARELLGKARELADGDDVTAVVFGDADTSGLGAWGADKVVTVQHDSLKHYNPVAYASALQQVVEDESPDVVLGSASVLGKDLLPRAAALCEASCASDVTDLREGDDGIEAVRPMYSGKCVATVSIDSDPKFFSVRANSFVLGDVEAGDGDVEEFDADLDDDSGYEVFEIIASGDDKVELTEASRIISGGRALGSEEKFAIFDEPARLMGAAIGASRAAVDAGYCPHNMQVGQTGKTVNPNLYIACGISGAIQHLAGMRTSKVIVAVNKDADAPIFQHATYGIVGDLFEVVPMLTSELEKVMTD
ncbi:MAG: electron transfer flavoprotein subunit alpha/FixB family protein [Proteobacteria bacterium]|nr:electron transfer flavoprotein subunit alpha/FixB family protein [Pseudomonadota bacterium]